MVVKLAGQLLVHLHLLRGLNLALSLALPVLRADLVVDEGYLLQVCRVQLELFLLLDNLFGCRFSPLIHVFSLALLLLIGLFITSLIARDCLLHFADFGFYVMIKV